MIGVSYRYPRADADTLQEVDARFPTGSFTVVMGPTGAGKSTLLMTLNGVIPHLKEGTMTGRVLLDGADLRDFRVQTITRHVGLVLQDPESQILGRTVAEDVAFGPRNYLVPRADILRRVDDCLSAVQLSGFGDRETAQLSGGQKQRLAIAGVLALRPQVLCLDEPASELDPQGRAEMYATLDQLREGGSATIIAVEHDSADVVHRADHLVVLRQGRVSWRGAPGDFFRDLDLVTANLLKPLPVVVVGTALCEAGLIGRERIPLDVDEAATLIRELAGGRTLPPPSAPVASSPSSAEPIIELRDVVHTYDGGHRGLCGINLTITPGDYVALIGRNGAGKTSLVKHLNGLLRPTSGSVAINGIDAATLPTWELARHVGYVFQNPDHQIFCTSVADEIRYGLTLAQLSPGEIAERVDDALAVTGLTDVRDEHPFSLGKGYRQRIAVASILALRPAILVVDEPTTGQDWAGVQTMMALIDRLNAEGTTIVLVTHDIDVVAHHARRVIVLNEGRITADGPTPEVLTQADVLRDAAITPPQTVDLCRRLWPDRPPVLDEAVLGRALAHALLDEAGG